MRPIEWREKVADSVRMDWQLNRDKYDERIKKMSKSWFKEGEKPIFTLFQKGMTPWNKNKKGVSLETHQKMSLARMKYKLEKHPNWLDGKSFEPYGLEFNKTLKEQIRIRDNYTCFICKKIQNKIKFPVHHKDYNKKNNKPENLITLCLKCHIKTNFNRENWLRFFGLGGDQV